MKSSKTNPHPKPTINKKPTETNKVEVKQNETKITTTEIINNNNNNNNIKHRSALITIGTYHSVLAGVIYRRRHFNLLFSIKHHEGCLRSVTTSNKYLASAGSDERVFLFTNKSNNNNNNKSNNNNINNSASSLPLRLADLGNIAPPCEMNCLLFTKDSQYLLCGGNDGNFIIYRTRDWSMHLSLILHEKSITGIAIHPGNNINNNNNNNNNINNNNSSGSALAVTIGADRYITILDLARGRLLSKWRYNPSDIISQIKEKENNNNNNNINENNNNENNTEDNEKPIIKRVKLERRETPNIVHFSPSGNYFTVVSNYSFAIYKTINMQLIAYYITNTPQPHEELHCFTFISEDVMIFGSESGELRSCRVSFNNNNNNINNNNINNNDSELTPILCTLKEVKTHIPEEVEQNNNNNNNINNKGISRHPTQHTTRVKSLHCMQTTETEMTLFSLDAAGAIIAWKINENNNENINNNNNNNNNNNISDISLTYICSANCQGRITTADILPL